MPTLNIFPENADARDVFSLRKTNPDNAFTLAAQLIIKKPDDLWIKRAYAWTLYDQAKLCIRNKNFDKAIEFIANCEKIDLPDGEEDLLIREKINSIKGKIILPKDIPSSSTLEAEKDKIEKIFSSPDSSYTKEKSEKTAWEIYRYLKAANESKLFDAVFVNRIFKVYKKLIIEKPSAVHSIIFYEISQLFKHDVKGLDLVPIMECWNPPNDLTPDDFKETIHEGKRTTPYAEKFTYAYIKILLQLGDKDKIKNYLDQMDSIISKHPKYSWLPYQKCKLLLAASSDKEEILRNIIPVVKKKSSEFWTWSSLGEVLSNESDKALSCYCKALTCKGTETFLVKVRQNLAKILITKKIYPEAKYEINRIVEIKTNEKQRIPSDVNNWMKQEWYSNTKTPASNTVFYNRNFKIAEDIVFGESVKSFTGVITNIDKASGKAYFSVSKTISGGFKPKKQQLLKTGDILEFKLNEKNEGGLISYDVLSAEKTSKLPGKEIYREFEGILKISKGGEIGFIDSVYVSKSLIESAGVKNNNLVKGIAIYSLNKIRNDFGWKAIKVWRA